MRLIGEKVTVSTEAEDLLLITQAMQLVATKQAMVASMIHFASAFLQNQPA